jgi:D-3-phosphoglycerate dehydrogenase / 2-oxoglutarate reductase
LVADPADGSILASLSSEGIDEAAIAVDAADGRFRREQVNRGRVVADHVPVSGEVRTPLVAVLGTRYEDLSIEQRILEPVSAAIVSGDGSTKRAILDVAAGADAILAGSGPRFDDEVLAELSCRAIVRYGVGTESVDLGAATRRGMWVVSVPDYGTEAVSFHAFTLAVAALRRVLQADASVKAGGWGFKSLRPLHLPSSMTASVVGFGRIGRRTAELFASTGFSVLAHDPFTPVDQAGGVLAASLEEALVRSDVMSLHAPGGSDGKPLLGAPELEQMKPGSVLVNTSRGSLVDLEALIEGLRQGRPAVAALDVYPREPPDVSIFEDVAERVVLSPHMAWYTEESERDLREKASQEVLRVLKGQPPLNPVATPEGATA